MIFIEFSSFIRMHGFIAHTKSQINQYFLIKMCVIIIAKSPFMIIIVVDVANACFNLAFYHSVQIESEWEIPVCFQLNM